MSDQKTFDVSSSRYKVERADAVFRLAVVVLESPPDEVTPDVVGRQILNMAKAGQLLGAGVGERLAALERRTLRGRCRSLRDGIRRVCCFLKRHHALVITLFTTVAVGAIGIWFTAHYA